MTATTTDDRTTFTAVYERDKEGMWLAELEEIPQVHTYGRSLIAARDHLLDAARLWFDDGRTINLHEDIRLPSGVRSSVNRAVTGRRKATEATTAAADATRKAARSLANAGITIRDSADILGLSAQRIHQLLAPEENSSK